MFGFLFRLDSSNREELLALLREAKNKEICVFTNRNDPKINNLNLIGRYSVLPFYQELEDDLAFSKSKLIHDVWIHNYIAGFSGWHARAMAVNPEHQPEAWGMSKFCRQAPANKKYVVKGATNSRKHSWNKKMFAANKNIALDIAAELSQDSLICDQPIIFKEYVPLETFEVGINDLPFVNEWRCFFLGEHLIASGFYWSIAEIAEKKQKEGIPFEGLTLAMNMASEINKYFSYEKTPFLAIDVAKKKYSNGWIITDVNDGQMAGLSMINPSHFYKNLILTAEKLSL